MSYPLQGTDLGPKGKKILRSQRGRGDQEMAVFPSPGGFWFAALKTHVFRPKDDSYSSVDSDRLSQSSSPKMKVVFFIGLLRVLKLIQSNLSLHRCI